MTREEIVAKVNSLIRNQSDNQTAEISSSTSFTDDLGMDSLTKVDLIADVETTFSIEVPDAELAGMASAGALVEFVVKAVGA